MAFGLNINFSGIVGSLTKGIRSIVGTKIGTLNSMVKTFSINNVTNSLVSQLEGMIGTSLNLNMSKLTGGINFANALKGLPFPSLSNLNLNSLYGLIDENIGLNLNNFSKGLAKSYQGINLEEISLGGKLTGAVNNQINSITDEVQAGTIAGKSSLNVLDELNNLSNRQIRDFTFNPQLQLDFVNKLANQQKDKIFDLSFNNVPQSTIFDNQINTLQSDSLGSFTGTTNLDYSFNSDEIINQTSLTKGVISKQRSQIFSITETTNPLTRKIDLKDRYNKEEKTLLYLESLNDDFKDSNINA